MTQAGLSADDDATRYYIEILKHILSTPWLELAFNWLPARRAGYISFFFPSFISRRFLAF